MPFKFIIFHESTFLRFPGRYRFACGWP